MSSSDSMKSQQFSGFVAWFGSFDSNGDLEVRQSVDKFQEWCTRYVSEQKATLEVVSVAVNEVFDDNVGVSLKFPDLVLFTLQKLNANRENIEMLRDRIEEYVRHNSGSPNSGRKFGITKGRGEFRGVVRWCDLPQKAIDRFIEAENKRTNSSK